MTTLVENETLTRVGTGTPMGDLMRQYWLPALKSSELMADGDPVRFKLLGEQLIAFRDTAGRIGVMDHRCPHRCASLFFGRNEEGGIRCVYHGWKFDVEGNCLDMANVPPHQDFKHKVHAKAYRARERNGLVWVFMGNADKVPELPPLEAALVPEHYMDIDFHQRDCNWLQALEGEIDSSHVAWLHYGLFQKNDFQKDSIRGYQVATRAPEFVTHETDAGFMYGVHRPAEDGKRYWRIAHFAFPCWALPPINNIEFNFLARAYVPLDDTHTMCIVMTMKGDPYKREIAKMPGGSMALPLLPNSTDWLGRFRVALNSGNDYGIDRDVQRRLTYTGIEGIITQDHAVTESIGSISPRELEHLAPSDMMITRVRRLLIRSAEAHAEQGTLPKSATDASVYAALRSGQFVAPETQDWLAATAEKIAQNPVNYALAEAAE
jgi:phenylpropionate dioxygenase-like ring-hydroxylating dioxygenase large terminal subunit